MAGRDANPDFVESIARGFDVIKAFRAERPVMTLSDVASAAGLARPTARRILGTLDALGYVRTVDGRFALTPRVLELGLSYVQSVGLWDVARPHMEQLVARTHESSSIAQLDGSDIVYVARTSVPKLITLAVHIGTRFPAVSTSLGKVLLADLDRDELDARLAEPSRSGIDPRIAPTRDELDEILRDVRAKGWTATDEQLARGIRSVAVPLRGGSGRTVAAINTTVHAAETSMDTLLDQYLPLLLRTASEVSAEFALRDELPLRVLATGRPPGADVGLTPGAGP